MKPKTSALATSSSLYNCHVVWVEKHPVWSEYILHLPHSATLWEPIQTSGFASPFTLITLWYFVSFDTCWSLLACFSFTEQDVLCEQTFDQAIRRGIPKHPDCANCTSSIFFHLPSSGWWTLCILRKGRGTYRYSLWCCRPCWDAWLVPALDLSSRMPADVRIRTLVLNLLDLVPKFRPRCSTSNGSMMTTGISEHQRQEDDFAQTVNGQPRKHRRSASNMFKERRSLQSQPVDACSLSCHISRQFWGITDFEFFPRPWLREKQWHTVHDMHWPPMIHGHSNAGRKRKSPQPDLTPGHSDRIQTYYSNIFWSSQVMVFDRFHVFCLYVCVFCVECRITQLRLSACCGITRHSSRLSQVSCTTMTSWRLELPTTIRLHRHTLYIRCEVSGQVQTLSFINCCMLLPVLESSRNTMLLYIYIYIYVTDILIFVAYPDRLWNTKKTLRC